MFEKKAAIAHIQLPKDKSALESFLGICSFYKKFVKNFSSLAWPLNELLKTTVEFPQEPTPTQLASFLALKAALQKEVVLAYPSRGATVVW